jgi:hypothetical protein
MPSAPRELHCEVAVALLRELPHFSAVLRVNRLPLQSPVLKFGKSADAFDEHYSRTKLARVAPMPSIVARALLRSLPL